MPDPSLVELQRWMSILVQHPGDADAASRQDDARALVPRGAAVAGEVIKPSDKLRPLERVDVYGNGYAARLIEVIESDFSALKYALGDDAWYALTRAYVQSFPSQHPNLNRFAARLPEFVAAREDLENRAFFADLARLNWGVVEAFDAPQFTPLDMTTLQSLTEDQWSELVLHPNPSLRLLTFEYPVNRFLQDFLDDKLPVIPTPLPTHVSIYRKDGRVWRTRLSPPAFRILSALASGEPFAAALATAQDEEVDVGHWFQEWSADGVFV